MQVRSVVAVLVLSVGAGGALAWTVPQPDRHPFVFALGVSWILACAGGTTGHRRASVSGRCCGVRLRRSYRHRYVAGVDHHPAQHLSRGTAAPEPWACIAATAASGCGPEAGAVAFGRPVLLNHHREDVQP